MHSRNDLIFFVTPIELLLAQLQALPQIFHHLLEARNLFAQRRVLGLDLAQHAAQAVYLLLSPQDRCTVTAITSNLLN
jgi:hypothetical protein